MASLLDRLSAPSDSAGPTRTRVSPRPSSSPYNRNNRPPKGDIDSPWTHDLFEQNSNSNTKANPSAKPNSLSARLGDTAIPPRATIPLLAERALRDVSDGGLASSRNPSSSSTSNQLSIKGASTASQGNVIEVSGLVSGTTPEDVAAIFKQCGIITSARLVSTSENIRIRVTFKTNASAAESVRKFDGQAADGRTLEVKIVGVGAASQTLGGRLGGADGLGIVREEGSVDVLMNSGPESGSKLRSDDLLMSAGAQVLTAPPGLDPAEHVPSPAGGGRGSGQWRRGGGRGRGGKRGGRGANKMDVD